jgi:hypothetical protein
VTPEEITVYGDRYARWDDTAWHVQSEVIFPLGLALQDGEGAAFVASAWQLELALRCQKGEAQLWEGIEVSCALQEASLRAASPDSFRRPRERERVQGVLANLERALEGAVVQLQVSAAGTVPDIDLEGITSRNLPQRESQETLRQLLSLAMAGFALRLPEEGLGTWLEYHSALMDLPSPTASRGSSRTIHQATLSDGQYLVVSQGRGTTALPSPGSLGGETVLSMVASAEATIRTSDGVLCERCWTVEGQARDPAEPVRLSGALRLLGPGETVTLGPSGQVGDPGTPQPGLPAWVPVADCNGRSRPE